MSGSTKTVVNEVVDEVENNASQLAIDKPAITSAVPTGKNRLEKEHGNGHGEGSVEEPVLPTDGSIGSNVGSISNGKNLRPGLSHSRLVANKEYLEKRDSNTSRNMYAKWQGAKILDDTIPGPDLEVDTYDVPMYYESSTPETDSAETGSPGNNDDIGMPDNVGHGLSILDKAKALITSERSNAYGPPEENLETIGIIWGALLNRHLSTSVAGHIGPIDPRLVAVMMAGLKLSRLACNLNHEDSIIDLAGYAGTIEMVNKSKNKVV